MLVVDVPAQGRLRHLRAATGFCMQRIWWRRMCLLRDSCLSLNVQRERQMGPHELLALSTPAARIFIAPAHAHCLHVLTGSTIARMQVCNCGG